MGLFDDPFGTIANVFLPATNLLGIGPGGKAVGNFVNPKPNDPTPPPATPNPQTDQSTADAMQKAEEEEQQKAQGEAANFLTSGGGAGLSSTGRTSRTVLLGS